MLSQAERDELLTEHAELSRETVRRRLAENELKPWRRDMWCIPEVDGTYVARMEDVLDLYAEAADRALPGYITGITWRQLQAGEPSAGTRSGGRSGVIRS